MRLAYRDIIDGLAQWRIWMSLSWFDILGKYRRSIIGPWWLTISIVIFIGFLGVIYTQILHVDARLYIPHLAIGYVVWILLSGIMLESCQAFIDAQSIILQRSIPLSIHIYRVVCRNVFMFFHNILVFVPVALIFGIPLKPENLLVVPGLFLACLNGLWIGLLFAIFSTRFRDLPSLIASLVQLLFFLTPVIWMLDQLEQYRAFIELNIFYHLIELVRAPLLGHAPSSGTFVVVLVTTALGWLVTFFIYSRYRQRIVYWL